MSATPGSLLRLRGDSINGPPPLYALLADGLNSRVSLRRRSQLRGKRLFDVASVRTFLHAQMQGGGE